MAEKHLSGKHPVVHDSYLNYIYSKKQTNDALILYPSGDDELRRMSISFLTKYGRGTSELNETIPQRME